MTPAKPSRASVRSTMLRTRTDLLATRTGSAAVSAGDSFLLAAFASAFFGSAVLRDGQFHIFGNIVGVITARLWLSNP